MRLLSLLLAVLLPAAPAWAEEATPTGDAAAQPPDDREAAAEEDGAETEEDVPASDGLKWRIFADVAPLLYVRTIARTVSDSEAAVVPHVRFGVGVSFPEGIGKNVPDPFADLRRPFSIRVGYLTGGRFTPFGGSDEDLATADDSFSVEALEIGFIQSWEKSGRGPTIISGSWQMVGETGREFRFRGQTIATGERIRQSVTNYGVIVPFSFLTGVNLSLAEPTNSRAGLQMRYEFIEAGFEFVNPTVEGKVSSHVIYGGLFFDWAVTRWLKVSLTFDAGGFIGYPGFALQGDLRIEFAQPQPFILDDHLEILAWVDVSTTTLQLRNRAPHVPDAPRDHAGDYTWTEVQIGLGLRGWF